MLITALVVAGLLQVPDTGRTESGLWYEARGTGDAVVLLHGANLDARSWGALPDALSATHRVITLDLRSHGHSADASGPFSWTGDVIEVLDALRLGRVVLAGHSLGAEVALDVALAHPDRVRGLVLIGPAIGGKPLTKPPAGFEALIAALRAGDLPAAGTALAAMPVMQLMNDTTHAALVRSVVRDNVRLFRAKQDWIRRPSPPAIERLETVSVPVLVLMGGRDPTESNAAGRVLLERAPGATGTMFDRCGHLVPIDCGPEALDAITRFLQDLPKSGAGVTLGRRPPRSAASPVR